MTRDEQELMILRCMAVDVLRTWEPKSAKAVHKGMSAISKLYTEEEITERMQGTIKKIEEQDLKEFNKNIWWK